MTKPTITRADLVERIARGICIAGGHGDPDKMVLHPAQASHEAPAMRHWEAWIEEAETALAAIHDAGCAVLAYEALPTIVWPNIAAADLAKEDV